MGGRVLPALEISEVERAELLSLAARRSTAQALALRARIVLGCAHGDPKPFRWTKSADDILASIERFCVHNTRGIITQTSEPGH